MVKKSIDIWKNINWKAKSLYLLGILFMISIMQIINLEDTKIKASSDIENFARSNARYIVKGIGECVKSEIQEHGYTTLKEMQIVLKNCGAEMRSGGPTGDFFAVDLITKIFVYDGSEDCLKGGDGRCFDAKKEVEYINNNIKQGECWIHKDKELCVKAIQQLSNIKTTDSNSKIYWQFDDSIEWLESYTIPSNSSGFNGPIGFGGVSSKDNIQLMIVIGTQKDEVYNQFTNIFDYSNKIDNIITFITVVFCIMLFITTLALKKCDNGNTNIHNM